MNQPISDIASTSSVKAVQEQRGSRQVYAKVEERGGWQKEVTPELRNFIAQRDSFYLGTASSDGQPYIQHRGGPKGLLKVLNAIAPWRLRTSSATHNIFPWATSTRTTRRSSSSWIT